MLTHLILHGRYMADGEDEFETQNIKRNVLNDKV